MGKYIKKVGVTPVRGNGFIINSFHTNDNKMFNAPSLGAVEDRTDNNLLFNGALINFRTGGFKVNGWNVVKATSYVGSEAVFSPLSGLIVPGGYQGTLVSPNYCASDSSDFDFTSPYSLSFLIGDLGSSDTVVGKIENILDTGVQPTIDTVLDERLKVSMDTFRSGGRLSIRIQNVTEDTLLIMAVKLEKGPTCTDIKMVGKEYGVQSYVIDKISDLKTDLALGTYLKLKTKTINIGSIASTQWAHTSDTVDIAEDDYRAIAIVGWESLPSFTWLKSLEIASNGTAVFYDLYNMRDSAVVGSSFYVDVLYIKRTL